MDRLIQGIRGEDLKNHAVLAKHPIFKRLRMMPGDIERDPIRKNRVENAETFVSSLRKTEFGGMQNEFVAALYSRVFREHEFETALKRGFGGKVVVDLGCGASPFGVKLCAKIGADTYVGVETSEFLLRIGLNILEVQKSDLEGNTDIGFFIVITDLLKFLSRLPDASVNFMINGMGWEILKRLEYRERAAREVERATEKNGMVVMTCSDWDFGEDKMRKIVSSDRTLVLEKM